MSQNHENDKRTLSGSAIINGRETFVVEFFTEEGFERTLFPVIATPTPNARNELFSLIRREVFDRWMNLGCLKDIVENSSKLVVLKNQRRSAWPTNKHSA